jgi:hypothetical protein
MKFLFINNEVIEDINGVSLLESLYDEKLRKPIFIDVIYMMSTKLGTYKKEGNVWKQTEEKCNNINVLGTLNIE